VKTVQTNVRVAETEKPLIIATAARLRVDAAFRDRLLELLNDTLSPDLDHRVKKLEQQVSWLLSGAIVVPRAVAPAVAPRLGSRPARLGSAGDD
jgi:hypothetical protein